MPSGYPIDWHGTDWARPTREIAEEKGCNPCTVRAARWRYVGGRVAKGWEQTTESVNVCLNRLAIATAREAADDVGVSFSRYISEAVTARLKDEGRIPADFDLGKLHANKKAVRKQYVTENVS